MWRYAAGIVVVGGIAAWAGGPIGVLLGLPVIAWFASRLLVHGGAGVANHMRSSHAKQWNGIYYEFGTIHLRALEHAGALVFVEDDILAVIQQPGSTTLQLFGPTERVAIAGKPWQLLTEAGCERLLLKCPHAEAKKLLLYLRREVFAPFAKRRDRFGP